MKGAGETTSKWPRSVAITVLVLVAGLAALQLRDAVSDWVCHRELDRYLHTNIRRIGDALRQYSYDNNGFFPYHPDGQDKALYLLKPYVKSVSIFDSEFAHTNINGPAGWDDNNKSLVGGDYDYINWPELYRRTEWRNLVILAEKTGVRVGAKSYLTFHPFSDLYLYAPDFSKEIIGGMLFHPEGS